MRLFVLHTAMRNDAMLRRESRDYYGRFYERCVMKRIVTGLVVVFAAVGLTLGGVGAASAAQGGINADSGTVAHTWVKVGRAELNQRGAQAACLSTGLGYWGCDGLVSELNRQKSIRPNANGYWAEKYYNRANSQTIRVQSGTW